jgi:SAM-dependent methyltransferase
MRAAGASPAARKSGAVSRGIQQPDPMDRQTLSSIAHTDHPIAAPVDEANADRLLRRAACRPDARILDLGCGEAAWTLRALDLYPQAHADAVDLSTPALTRASAAALDLGFIDRLTLHQLDARDYRDDTGYDLVMCIGSTHAFGGLAATLEAARGHLRPGGTLLLGDGFWERPPTEPSLRGLDATPDDFLDLAGTVDLVEKAGWAPVYAHVSDAAEWDDYEWSWVGSLTRWALDNPDHPDASRSLAVAREHREGWLRGYRNVFGFVCLLLSPVDGGAA